MDLGLTGKTVLITGASQGIGEGLAVAFASEGCHCKLTARNAANLERIESQPLASDVEMRFGRELGLRQSRCWPGARGAQHGHEARACSCYLLFYKAVTRAASSVSP